MAKRVTTSIKYNGDDFWDDETGKVRNVRARKSKSNVVSVVILTLLVCVLLAIISIAAYNSIKNQARTQQQYGEEQNDNHVVEQSKPINISQSGKGMSSTEQFEMPTGNYLISYSYANNAVYYGEHIGNEGTNFISEIKCASGMSYPITNDISIDGKGSEYVAISEVTKCFYQVEKADSKAEWSIKIVDN